MSEWLTVGPLEAIPQRGSRVVESIEGEIAVFRTSDDNVFALRDSCPHKGGALSQGIVYGDNVACPLHNWSIRLANGEAVAPDKGCARKFEVKVEAGIVHINI